MILGFMTKENKIEKKNGESNNVKSNEVPETEDTNGPISTPLRIQNSVCRVPRHCDRGEETEDTTDHMRETRVKGTLRHRSEPLSFTN